MGRRPMTMAVLLIIPSLAHAHDFWLERDGAGMLLRYGHHGGELLAIDSAKIKTVRCLAKGTTRDLLPTAAFAPKEVKLGGPCDAASAFFDGGYWSLTPDGEVNRPKNEVAQAVKAWASRQFAKWVDARSPSASAIILGDELELMAVGDISKAREGDKVTVRVLSAGRPVPSAVVAIDHKPLGESDSAGDVRVRLRTSGVQTVSVTVRRSLSTPEADSLVLEASLSFEVAR
jgi:uncharacterized GH25 family protein